MATDDRKVKNGNFIVAAINKHEGVIAWEDSAYGISIAVKTENPENGVWLTPEFELWWSSVHSAVSELITVFQPTDDPNMIANKIASIAKGKHGSTFMTIKEFVETLDYQVTEYCVNTKCASSDVLELCNELLDWARKLQEEAYKNHLDEE